jgi:hypothetical protein
MWTHGHSVHAEDFEGKEWTVQRFGPNSRVWSDEGPQGAVSWFHFAVPTPVIVEDRRMKILDVQIRFMGDAVIDAIDVWDGTNRLASFKGLTFTGGEEPQLARLEIPEQPEVLWGIGISVHVLFDSIDRTSMNFIAAGADFI